VTERAARVSVTHVDVDDGWERDEETGGLVLMLRESDGLAVGGGEPDGAARAQIEYRLDGEETLVVLRGSGEVRADDGAPIELRPGVVVSLPRGSELSWLVDDDFRELWIYS
jgi:ethanolamine utilization protein EutQ (cupin superfamily)